MGRREPLVVSCWATSHVAGVTRHRTIHPGSYHTRRPVGDENLYGKTGSFPPSRSIVAHQSRRRRFGTQQSPASLAGDEQSGVDRLVVPRLVCFDRRMKRCQHLRYWVLGLSLASLITWIGCVTNEAGRHQLMLVSQADEMQLGLNSFAQLKKDTPICQDPAANEMVRRVGERIKSVVKLDGAQWE